MLQSRLMRLAALIARSPRVPLSVTRRRARTYPVPERRRRDGRVRRFALPIGLAQPCRTSFVRLPRGRRQEVEVRGCFWRPLDRADPAFGHHLHGNSRDGSFLRIGTERTSVRSAHVRCCTGRRPARRCVARQRKIPVERVHVVRRQLRHLGVVVRAPPLEPKLSDWAQTERYVTILEQCCLS